MKTWEEDTELLAALGQLWAEPASEPSTAELAFVRDAARFVQFAKPPERHPRRMPIGVAVAAAACFLGVALTHTPLPTPIRTAAVAIGLPINDAAVAAVRSQETALEQALAAKNTAEVRSDLSRLDHRVRSLTPADQRRVGPQPALLVGLAEEFLNAHAPSVPAASSASTPSTTSPTSTTAITPTSLPAPQATAQSLLPTISLPSRPTISLPSEGESTDAGDRQASTQEDNGAPTVGSAQSDH